MPLHEQGYEIRRGALGPAAADGLLTAIDEWLAEQAAERGKETARGKRGVLACPAVRRLTTEATLHRLLRPLDNGPLGDGPLGEGPPRAVRGILFDKTPGANWRVGWHQDLVTAFAERVDTTGYSAWSDKDGVPHAKPPIGLLERMVTVRLHLDDCGPANGPLEVLPGTHRRGELSAEGIRHAIADQAPTVCTAAGDALVMRPLLLHASAKAATPSRRRVLHLEYAFEDPPGGAAWPVWAA